MSLAAVDFRALPIREDGIVHWDHAWLPGSTDRDPAGMVPLVTLPGHDPFRWPPPQSGSLWRNVNDGLVYEVLGVLHRSPGGAIDEPLIEYRDRGGPAIPYWWADHPLWCSFPSWYANWTPWRG